MVEWSLSISVVNFNNYVVKLYHCYQRILDFIMYQVYTCFALSYSTIHKLYVQTNSCILTPPSCTLFEQGKISILQGTYILACPPPPLHKHFMDGPSCYFVLSRFIEDLRNIKFNKKPYNIHLKISASLGMSRI